MTTVAIFLSESWHRYRYSAAF